MSLDRSVEVIAGRPDGSRIEDAQTMILDAAETMTSSKLGLVAAIG